MSTEERIAFISSLIRNVPDFPKPGIQFKDITTLIKDPKGLKTTIDLFVEKYKGAQLDYVAGIEARGFIFGTALALALGVGFIPLRKPSKLPAEKVSLKYQLEYGVNELEIHKDAIEPGKKVLVVDDLIATGGTLECGCKLIEQIGGVVVGCACVAELPELNGRKAIAPRDLFVLAQFYGV
eukprot:TRINITY_DN1560_c0_g1_i3.p1 TRINITY_DN1560_c0_g1~~TRINITY_DN1560_c0_g1_i3.p1  ORF type:complete len:181 (-),score=45.09 TRINITY_DN1560_c0_g1_i3:463-1005(-)